VEFRLITEFPALLGPCVTSAEGRDLLYVTHRVPYPPDKGDRIRNYHLLRHLSRFSGVHLATLSDEPVSGETIEALEQLCERVAIVPARRWSRPVRAALSVLSGRTASEGVFDSPQLRSILARWSRQTRFRAALASASSVAQYLRIPSLRAVPAVVDLVDVDSQKWIDYAAAARGPQAWFYRFEGRRVRRLERSLPTWARAVTLVSEDEATLYRGIGPARPGIVSAVTNGVDLDYFCPVDDAGVPAECVFVGALDYRPNVEGIRWFCRSVWPGIVRVRPGVRLSIVGRNPTVDVLRLATIPGVDVVGSVPDVRPHLAGAAIVIVPLQLARGVQNKVLEAMAMGKPVLASRQAIDGLRVESGAHLLTASTPVEWERSLIRLLGDRAARRAIGAAGRAFVEENHRWERCLGPFTALLGLPEDRGSSDLSVERAGR
jgi:sugar transferase (PEP-CTERM/EpsH1 system associated)